MSNLTFIILLPNAKREKVRVTQDTSILQILEDCCTKQGFNANEWNFKHYNNVVELGNSVRFSGLPNNATLEMVQSARPRVETPINLVLILESGKRLITQFFPKDTLWQVLEHWSSEGEEILGQTQDQSRNTEPVCIYMRQEIVGQIKLEDKTLKSLGLYQGSAVIRLVHRPINQVLKQANPNLTTTSGVLPNPKLKLKTSTSHFTQSKNIPKNTSHKNSNSEEEEENDGGGSTAITAIAPVVNNININARRTHETLNVNHVGRSPGPGPGPGVVGLGSSRSAKLSQKNALNHPNPNPPATGSRSRTASDNLSKPPQTHNSNNLPATNTNINTATKVKLKPNPKPVETAARGSVLPTSGPIPVPAGSKSRSSSQQGRQSNRIIGQSHQANNIPGTSTLGPSPNQIRQLHAQPGELHILGPHDILVYHGDDVNLPHIESLPDEFYDVTVQDVQAIYRGLQTRRTELEEAPLQTRSARNLEHDNNVQRNLVTHPFTTVRVRFPDRFILQGIFKTNDSFRLIYNVLRGYLEDVVSNNFYLFSTPPRKILHENTTLIEEGLVGFAIIYFGTESNSTPQSRYIKPSFPLSDPERVFNFKSSSNQQNGEQRQQGSGAGTTMARRGVVNSENPRDPNWGRISNGPASGTSSGNHPPGSNSPGVSRPNDETRRQEKNGRASNANVIPKWFKKN